MGVNVINYFYHLIMGRILGPENYGVLASIFAILYILSVVPTSSSFAIVKFISSTKKDSEIIGIFRTLKRFIFRLALILSVVLLASSPLIANFLHIKNVVNIVLVAPMLYLSLLTLLYQATCQGLLKFWGYIGPALVLSVAKLVIGILLVITGLEVFGAVVGIFTAFVLAYFYALSMSKYIPSSKKEDPFDMIPFFKFSIPVVFQALAFTSFFTTDVILVKHFMPPFEAGLYAALSTLGKIIYFAASPVTSVMFPVVSGKKSRGEKYDRVFYLTFLVTFIVSFTVVAFFYLFPTFTIKLLYGEKYLTASSELAWMGIFIGFYTLSYLIANFILSIGKTRIVIIPATIALVQIAAISRWHFRLLQIIQVSFLCMLALFLLLSSYLLYNRLRRIYAKSS